MDEKSLIRIFLSFTVMLASWSVDAHQPVLNSESRTAKSPYIIEEPEISKAIFSELKGEPHYYRIDSDSRFEFYAGITVPKIDNCPISKKFSFEVLDADFELIERKDGENFNWWPWLCKTWRKMVLDRTRDWREIQIQQCLQVRIILPACSQQI